MKEHAKSLRWKRIARPCTFRGAVAISTLIVAFKVRRTGFPLAGIAEFSEFGATEGRRCDPSCNTDHGAVSAGRDDDARNIGVEGKPKVL